LEHINSFQFILTFGYSYSFNHQKQLKVLEMGLEQNYARNQVLTIGTTEVLVSDKKQRKALYLRNTSTVGQIITIAFDNLNAVTAGQGIILSPGEFLTDSNNADYKVWNGEIKAIATAAGATLSVMEQELEGGL